MNKTLVISIAILIFVAIFALLYFTLRKKKTGPPTPIKKNFIMLAYTGGPMSKTSCYSLGLTTQGILTGYTNQVQENKLCPTVKSDPIFYGKDFTPIPTNPVGPFQFGIDLDMNAVVSYDSTGQLVYNYGHLANAIDKTAKFNVQTQPDRNIVIYEKTSTGSTPIWAAGSASKIACAKC